MQVHYGINQLPVFRKAVVTIGTFDGVHLGHQKIIEQLKAAAAAIDGENVIITFHPHPRMVLHASGHSIQLLTLPDEKIELLSDAGIDHLVVVAFDEAFAKQSAKDYIHHFLVEKFHPHTIIIGYDHHFGHNREGNYQLLADLQTTFGYSVQEISANVLKDITISSTSVREALLQGNVQAAAEWLGYAYSIEGKVIIGQQLGRTIGFPTANIQIGSSEKLIPSNGVYVVEVQINKEPPFFGGMMNIGFRPTVDGRTKHIEVHLFNFNENLYDATIKVYFLKKLRNEIKFEGLEALKAQLAKDMEESLAFLASR